MDTASLLYIETLYHHKQPGFSSSHNPSCGTHWSVMIPEPPVRGVWKMYQVGLGTPQSIISGAVLDLCDGLWLLQREASVMSADAALRLLRERAAF